MIARFAIALFLALAFLHGDERTDARLMDLNIVAVDSHGQPVTDLTRDEIRVTDAGKRRQIAFFRHDDGKLPLTPTLGPGEFSNRDKAASPHATLVLFDLLNERFDTRGITANQIVRDLGGIERASDLYLYLLTLDGRLFAVHGINGAWAEGYQQGAGPWTSQIKSLMDSSMRTVLQLRPVDLDVNGRIVLTFRALEAVAQQLSAFPGRKNIVWVTDGIPIALGPNSSDTGDFVDLTDDLRRLSEEFDRSGVSIYPVRQVLLGSPDAMGAAYGASGAGSTETLDILAGLTGGRPTGSKDIGAAVEQALNDVRNSYQIAYYPPEQNWDGKFHALRVTCTRKGVRIQARTGYYAMAEPAGARASRAIGTAIREEFDAGEIGLRVTAAAQPGDRPRIRLHVRIDANNIALAESGGGYSGHLRLALVEYQPGGRITVEADEPLDLNYTKEQRDTALKDGVDVNRQLNLEEGVIRLRCIVFDHGSNTLGSVTIPLDQGAPQASGQTAAPHN